MSKKYKGKTCVYCGVATSETADHVIGREFFLPNRRDNLPKVPACRRCNKEKSDLEHYLMAVLPFGGRHQDATVNLSTLAARRVQKNVKLQRKLAAGFAKSGGTTIPLDHVRLEKLFAMIAQGLAWHHWQVLLKDGYSALASMFDDSGEPFFDQMLSRWNTPNRVTGNLGENTFSYQGVQAADPPETTIWRFWMYGGIVFGGDPNLRGPSSLAIAVTGPSALIQKLRFKGAARRTKVGRNEPCPCGSGKKYKRCCGTGALRPGPTDDVTAPVYQPLAPAGISLGIVGAMRRLSRQQ